MENKEIIRNEILDKILALLMSFDAPPFNEMLKIINPKIIDMDFVAQVYSEYEWENYMKDSFKKELIFKNFIIEDSEGNLSITEIGREFKRKGGYEAIDKKEIQEDIIREGTIKSFRYDKLALSLSIVAIIISIIGLIFR